MQAGRGLVGKAAFDDPRAGCARDGPAGPAGVPALVHAIDLFGRGGRADPEFFNRLAADLPAAMHELPTVLFFHVCKP